MPTAPDRRAYQCGSCRRRYHTMQPIEWYQRQPSTFSRRDWHAYKATGRCPSCGRGILHDCTRHVRRWNRKIVCRDDGCPRNYIPHTRSTPGCAHHRDFDPWRAET